jgi:hypothetical protein
MAAANARMNFRLFACIKVGVAGSIFFFSFYLDLSVCNIRGKV